MPDSNRHYFAERHGRAPRTAPLELERLIRLVCNVWDTFDARYYFQKGLGYECVDAQTPTGRVAGDVGGDPAAYFERKLGRDDVWPYGKFATDWDLDTLLDMVEVLYEAVAKPTRGKYHGFYECGWHYHSFDQAAGQAEYRDEVNAVLRRVDPQFELNAEGEVIELGPGELRPLLDISVPTDTEEEIAAKLDAAVHRFRVRGASKDERRLALRELADILEFLRPAAKAHLLTKDENAIFELANGFSIRHHNQRQRGNYDKRVWQSWAFYVYLATIHALLRVRDRDATSLN